jgi:hypothetical protein
MASESEMSERGQAQQGCRGVNPKSFCTRWVERPEGQQQAATARYEALRRRAHYLRTHPKVAAVEARARARAPMAGRSDNRPFSIWKA